MPFCLRPIQNHSLLAARARARPPNALCCAYKGRGASITASATISCPKQERRGSGIGCGCGGVIKISQSARCFVPSFQKQPAEHDTRGRSSVFSSLRSVLVGKRDIDSSPPLHYLHKSRRRRRRRHQSHVCCERHGDSAHQLPAPLAGWPATCHAVRPSAGRAASGKLCLFALVCLPALSPVRRSDVPHSLPSPAPPPSVRLPSSLLFRPSVGSMWLRWSMRRRRRRRISVYLGCGIAKSHFENSSAAAAAATVATDQNDGRTDNCEASLAINTPSTVGLIFALVDRRRTAQNEPCVATAATV